MVCGGNFDFFFLWVVFLGFFFGLVEEVRFNFMEFWEKENWPKWWENCYVIIGFAVLVMTGVCSCIY